MLSSSKNQLAGRSLKRGEIPDFGKEESGVLQVDVFPDERSRAVENPLKVEAFVRDGNVQRHTSTPLLPNPCGEPFRPMGHFLHE
jgi:hypothetical protein